MKIYEIINETSVGGIATIAMPMGTTRRRPGPTKKKKKTNEIFADQGAGADPSGKMSREERRLLKRRKERLLKNKKSVKKPSEKQQ